MVSEDGVLEGIITNRDIRYLSRTDYADIYVRDIMTPMPLVTGTPGLTKDEAFTLLSKNKIERLPLVDAAGKLAGLITLKDFVKTEQYPRATKDEDGRLRAGAAIGFFGDGYDMYLSARCLLCFQCNSRRPSHPRNPSSITLMGVLAILGPLASAYKRRTCAG